MSDLKIAKQTHSNEPFKSRAAMRPQFETIHTGFVQEFLEGFLLFYDTIALSETGRIRLLRETMRCATVSQHPN